MFHPIRYLPLQQVKKNLFLFFLLVFCRSSAQTLQGVITEAQTGKPLSAVTVVNIATQQSVYTDVSGAFSLPLNGSRQVVFTYVGYKNIQKYITDEEIEKGVKVAMSIIRYELSEFILRPGYTPYQLDSIRRRAVYSRTMVWQRTSSVMSPFSLLADRLSHKSRQRYQFQKNFYKWEGEKFIDTRYTPELVASLTGLTGDTIGYFMNANPMPFDYARAATDLELKMWIRYNYKQWLKKPVIPVTDTVQTKVK